MAKRWGVYRDYLSKATGLPVKLFESSDYNGSIQALSSGQVDMAQIAGGGYANVDAQVGKLVAPILTVRQAEGDMGYYSALIVRADSPIKTLADMKGRSLGYSISTPPPATCPSRQDARAQARGDRAHAGRGVQPWRRRGRGDRSGPGR